MTAQEFYAHSKPRVPKEKWQKLREHLQNTAYLAKEFASIFGAGDWGVVAGLMHDIGKYSQEFQAILKQAVNEDANDDQQRGPDHSSAGAQELVKRFPDGRGKLLAYAVAGHHAGLLDGKSNDACLEKRLKKEVKDYEYWLKDGLNTQPRFVLPSGILQKDNPALIAFRLQFFVRMIFSCLVDADFLDTEAFLNQKKAQLRGNYPDIAYLLNSIRDKTKSLCNNVADTLVNRKRREILEQCVTASQWEPGIFSLTVPTGGGKTLSSLSFALEHAVKYGMKRVIYVIPYTSIIEQNADVFRQICGNDAVIEHHSNFDLSEDSYKSQLAAENWDAPLIVTTNVQFFETLFHHRVSKNRKAHNIANSVIIFDEAQMLPVHLLRPCMEAIKELASNYHSSIVLCSATQPALGKSDDFKIGIDGIREIVSVPRELYSSLRRVDIHSLPLMNDAAIAQRIITHDQVLCVVNTRKYARQLYETVSNKTGLFHLSALMCPAHRSEVLDTIRSLLKKGKTCRVISTQLIEAGVDIDFPIVYRALAGIDSIAQSAGRCNREGILPENGKVFVFMPENSAPPGFLRQSVEEAQGILRRHKDILSLDAVYEYFKNMYWRNADMLDKHKIMEKFAESVKACDFPFKSVSEQFKVIDNGMQTVIIPYNEKARKLIASLRASDSREIARKLQRYCVQVYPDVIIKLGRAALEPVQERYYILINGDLYKEDIGLDWDNPYFRKIEGNIC